ncbi:MAG: sigma 54-interacting transcriptional regulator [Planctomycetota bacterium]
MSAEAERARRYLLEGKPDLALAVCEGALPGAAGEDALALHLQAAGAAAELGDLSAQRRQLEGAEAAARAGGLDALGPVLLRLGEVHLRRDDPESAALALEEALGALDAADPLRARAAARLEEARARAEDAQEDDGQEGACRGGDGPAAQPTTAERRQAMAELAPTEWTERFLAMADRLLDADPDLDLAALLDLILAELVDAVGAERGFVLLRQPDGTLVVEAARDARGLEVPDPARQVSRKIAEQAAAELISLRAVRPAEDPRFAGSRSAKALDLQAVVAAPLRYRRKDLGSVLLDRRAPDVAPFDEQAEALVARFARIASGVIVRTRRRDAQKKRNEALTDLIGETTSSRLRADAAPSGVVGQSGPILRLLRLLERVAPTNARVLVRGESGTGKELVARTLHEGSPRRGGPFLALNCAALAETLLESELFGYVKGAFSGADADREGMFERAHGGTLFLDEIGDATPRLQAELLRVLQEGEVRRVGAARARSVDVRVITATHRDLEAMVAEGVFREDLLFRINAVELEVPPLRDRAEDVPLLARHFYARAVLDLPAPNAAPPLDEKVLWDLRDRQWRGNVRELQNVITRYVTVGELEPEARGVGARLQRRLLGAALPPTGAEMLTLSALERRALLTALQVAAGKKQRAAELLGISRRTLYNKLRHHGIED